MRKLIKQNFGFQLIEIMIVISIIGILGALSLPAYTHHLARGHRLAAEGRLLSFAAQLEQYQIENNAYQGATLSGFGMSADNYYRYEMQLIDDGYILTAVPIGRQAVFDPCGVLQVDSIGEKTAEKADCWGA